MGNLVQPTIKEAGQKAGNFLPDIQGPYLKKNLKAALFFQLLHLPCHFFLLKGNYSTAFQQLIIKMQQHFMDTKIK